MPGSPDGGGGLRARRRDATRMDIHEAAVDLFERNGFDATTVDEVAAAAGVSPRTFFRHFGTKEECVLYDRYGFDRALENRLSELDPDEFTLADIEAVYRSVMIGFGDEDRSDDVSPHFLRVRKLVLATPSLSRAALGRYADESRRLPEALGGRSVRRTRAQIRMILEVANLGVQCAFEEWVEVNEADGTGRSLVDVYDAVCERLRGL
ncbi:TetR family transcriptional regulator [Gordonia soli]|uniref:Putative TetR family transcriptional regulator n=1 Tax=Gordonia soli NBRC 108243 TaxID=1223545 RepID=M0QLE1_9ACTN|nr:TetR family transcriptional regulator [Gordonia soli]GAC69244.1 putative TetR family transcriptional regulator [Gordonia soli NBRC 108243]